MLAGDALLTQAFEIRVGRPIRNGIRFQFFRSAQCAEVFERHRLQCDLTVDRIQPASRTLWRRGLGGIPREFGLGQSWRLFGGRLEFERAGEPIEHTLRFAKSNRLFRCGGWAMFGNGRVLPALCHSDRTGRELQFLSVRVIGRGTRNDKSSPAFFAAAGPARQLSVDGEFRRA